MSAADLRPVHPAALRLARIVQHAGGQLQFGFRKRIRRGRRGEIRHRIIGRIQAFGGGILEARDDALAALGQRAALRPQRRIFARGVELLDRGSLGLAVEIAQGFRAQHVAQFVGDRLIGRRDVAGSLGRFLGGFGGRRRGGRRRSSYGGGGRGVVLVGVGRASVGLAAVGLAAVGGRRVAGVGGRSGDDLGWFGLRRLLRRLLSCCLGRVWHRRRGVQFEIVDGRRRDVCRFGTRDRRIDREFGGAVAGRIGLRKCRGRGHREEGRRDSHQHAVKSSTVLQTVTHRHTPWAKLPRHGTALSSRPYSFSLSAGSSVLKRIQSILGSVRMCSKSL